MQQTRPALDYLWSATSAPRAAKFCIWVPGSADWRDRPRDLQVRSMSKVVKKKKGAGGGGKMADSKSTVDAILETIE